MVLLNRLLANMGVAGSTPSLERFGRPVEVTKAKKRWLDGLLPPAHKSGLSV